MEVTKRRIRIFIWVLTIFTVTVYILNDRFEEYAVIRWFAGETSGFGQVNSAVTIFSYIQCGFSLLSVTVLAVPVCLIWGLMKGNDHLQANFKSMVPKIVFSFLSWVGLLSMVIVWTILYVIQKEEGLTDWIDNLITYCWFYLFDVAVTMINIVLAAVYLWWLSSQTLNPPPKKSNARRAT